MFVGFKKLGSAAHYFLLSTFLLGLTNGMFDAVYNFYLEERGIDKTSIGNIYFIAMLMMSAAIIPLMVANKKISQKKLLVTSAFFFAIPFSMLPFLTSVWAHSFTLGVISSGMIAQLSIGNSLIGSNVDAESRTTIFSYFFVAYLGAAMIGSILVSLLTYFSYAAPIRNYQIIIFAAFSSALLMIYTRKKSTQGIIDPGENKEQVVSNTNIEWMNFIVLFLAAALLGASITLVFRFMNLIFNLAYNMNISEIALVLGVDKIISIAGALFAPLLVKRFSLKLTIIIAAILTGTCLLLQSAHVPLAIFITLYFARLLLNYGLMPLLDTLAITGFSKDRTLLSTCMRQLAFYLGGAISALIYGKLLNNGQWEAALILSAAFATTGALFLSLIRTNKEN